MANRLTGIGRGLVGWALSAACSCFAIAVILAAPALASADTFMSPIGTIAAAEREHLFSVLLILLVAVVPVFVGVPIILWRYRRRASQENYQPKWEFDGRLETVMWTVPTLIVAALSAAVIASTLKLDPYKPLPGDALRVDVVGLDWKWLFLYPDEGVASVGELVIPVGQPVSLRITSDTVMQSFLIAALAGQIYAMPGMRTRLHIEANEAGLAEGEATQYNGIGFPEQRFIARAVDDADYQAWLTEAKASSITLDDETYHQLAKRTTLSGVREDLNLTGTGPVVMTLPSQDLFDRVLARYHQGTAIASAEQPGSPEYDPAAASLPQNASAFYGLCGPTLNPAESLTAFFGDANG